MRVRIVMIDRDIIRWGGTIRYCQNIFCVTWATCRILRLSWNWHNIKSYNNNNKSKSNKLSLMILVFRKLMIKILVTIIQTC